MRFEEIYKTLSAQKYYVFSCEDVLTFFPREKKASVKQYLSRWKKNGLVASLRKGLYELTFPARYGLSDLYLANKIYSPSYVSLETALSHYGMIPEVAMAVTSVTSKPTRRFKNHHGLFIYRSVQPQTFFGYTIENHGGFDVLIAEPEKALVDLLYFRTKRSGDFDLKALRLDRGRVSRLNRKKLNAYGRLYGMNVKEILHAEL